jgi:DNA replication and repair protein RecF
MRVDWLSLVDFRSYHSLEWQPDDRVNLLVGPNAAGKTNLLEGVGYLSSLKSFRSAPDTALIAAGADSAVLRAGIASGERQRLIEVEVPNAGSKKAQVDKTRLKRTADLLGVLRVIAFLPEDLDFVKRSPSYRRDLLDDLAVQLWPSAYLDQSEYDRSVRQRNAFLKSGEHDDMTLSVWDSRMAQAGGRVMARRARVIETLTPLLQECYQQISASVVRAHLEYEASWFDGPPRAVAAGEYADQLAEALERRRRADYERRITTVGPHRDEPSFVLDDREARTLASQGEQRTVALAVKLAAHDAVSEAVSDQPVLLLDDVFSELDPERAKALAGALPESTQTMITTARPEDVPVTGRVWSVREGVVR